MSNVILSLGGVVFQDFEVPEKIIFGGQQRVAVQDLIGGGRVVVALGLDDGKISFSGIFSGTDAVGRVQLLDAARAAGLVLPLVWDAFFYSVIIEGFEVQYQKTNLIPFSITCVVVSDPLALLTASIAPIANLIGGDLIAAGAFSGQAGMTLEGLSETSLAGFGIVQNALVVTTDSASTTLVTATTSFNNAADPVSGIDAINQINESSSQLAALTSMSGYVNRAAANIGAALV